VVSSINLFRLLWSWGLHLTPRLATVNWRFIFRWSYLGFSHPFEELGISNGMEKDGKADRHTDPRDMPGEPPWRAVMESRTHVSPGALDLRLACSMLVQVPLDPVSPLPCTLLPSPIFNRDLTTSPDSRFDYSSLSGWWRAGGWYDSSWRRYILRPRPDRRTRMVSIRPPSLHALGTSADLTQKTPLTTH
jgi:hypothetical protein